jgi:hypothetical protein
MNWSLVSPTTYSSKIDCCVWILEIYVDREKAQLLKVYEFNTMRDVGYVLNMTPSTVSNFYHNLINARGNLEYINIYQKKIMV